MHLLETLYPGGFRQYHCKGKLSHWQSAFRRDQEAHAPRGHPTLPIDLQYPPLRPRCNALPPSPLFPVKISGREKKTAATTYGGQHCVVIRKRTPHYVILLAHRLAIPTNTTAVTPTSNTAAQRVPHLLPPFSPPKICDRIKKRPVTTCGGQVSLLRERRRDGAHPPHSRGYGRLRQQHRPRDCQLAVPPWRAWQRYRSGGVSGRNAIGVRAGDYMIV